MFCSSGISRVALGQFAGKSSRSTQRAVYQPPLCQPIWVSHGQTRSGEALMVIAWSVTTAGSGDDVITGEGVACSSFVEPYVRPRRIRRGLGQAGQREDRHDRPTTLPA